LAFNRRPTLLAVPNSRPIGKNLVRDPGCLAAVRANQHNIGRVYRGLSIHYASRPSLPRIRLGVAFDHIHALDQDFVLAWHDLDDPAGSSPILAGYDHHPIISPYVYFNVHNPS
jgi:hypothetical protein